MRFFAIPFLALSLVFVSNGHADIPDDKPAQVSMYQALKTYVSRVVTKENVKKAAVVAAKVAAVVLFNNPSLVAQIPNSVLSTFILGKNLLPRILQGLGVESSLKDFLDLFNAVISEFGGFYSLLESMPLKQSA